MTKLVAKKKKITKDEKAKKEAEKSNPLGSSPARKKKVKKK